MIHEKRHSKEKNIVEYFTKDEAITKGIKFIPWREATEAGQWLLSDDGYVLECTRIKYINELQKNGKTIRTRRKIWTGLAIRYPHGRAPMNIEEHVRTRSYGLVPQYWFDNFHSRYPAVRQLLAHLVLSGKLGMAPVRKYYRSEYNEMVKLANKMFDSKHMDWREIRRYFGNEEVRKMIRQDIKKMAEDAGFTPEKYFDLMNEAITLGRAKADGRVLVTVAKEIAQVISMPHTLRLRPGQLPPPTDGQGSIQADDGHFDHFLERNTTEAVVTEEINDKK